MAALHCIVKLGGSAVTHKDCFESLKVEALQRAAGIVHALHRRGQRCIIVHGAGSFGHFQAKEFNVSKGSMEYSVDADYLRRGLCLTRLSVTKLNHLVTEELVKHGIPAVGISILSQELSPKHVVFLTDVDGIYDQPPDNPDAKLVDSIVTHLDGTFEPDVLTSALPHDITGGVKLKIQTATSIVAKSRGAVTVFICKLESESAEGACTQGEIRTGQGTKIFLAASTS
uniref:Isopentenyl phosphate kinase-like isoform X3 n=1 Tax=Geotrypetes seraphini TaxID=260995 RepID=A0A6P8PI39_GEOSA|nr:isopentenyl phosphate kinase-like isoform X3 [Geotrypetes seraphini]